MSFSFGRFEVDEPCRALRLDGQDCVLQPLVFDLLVYLVKHRDRVVPKDELLSQLWAGSIVTDGSRQRAVSLLRGALREGGMEDAVQTFARRGYRFCALERTETAAPAHEARKLADANQWDRALEAFATSDHSALSAEDWEAWGTAACCAGVPERAAMPLERAVVAFDEAGNPEGAARVALILANMKLESRELAIARGWHERARTYLKPRPEGKQHGLSEWVASRMALFDGKLDESRTLAARAMAIGERLADPDLQCLGLIYQGHILIALGEVRRGLSLHDEAGAATLAGRASPWVSGIVFCSVIWVYLHLGDHHRAGQWTDQFTRWCERHASYSFPALCRLHRGEIFAYRGEIATAEAEVTRARQQLAIAGPYAEGDACRVLGEIRLALGDLDGAEAAFREAHRLGWNPQPGLGLLLAARGRSDDALKQIDKALAQPTWTDGQRRGIMLAVLARIAAQTGQLTRAQAALDTLAAAPELTSSQTTEAERSRAEGELSWATRDLTKAEHHLRRSVAFWLQTGAPWHAAEVRLRLCELLVESADFTAAELEVDAAESAYRQVGADPQLQRCHGLRAACLRASI